MKFAKELEESLVPEWREKYLDYGLGKKKIKDVKNALRNVQRKSPKTSSGKLRSTPDPTTEPYGPLDTSAEPHGDSGASAAGQSNSAEHQGFPVAPRRIPTTSDTSSGAGDGDALNNRAGRFRRYGSIVGSPPSRPVSRPASFNIGEPALDTDSEEALVHSDDARSNGKISQTPSVQEAYETPRRSDSMPAESTDAFAVGTTRSPSRMDRYISSRHMSEPGLERRPSLLHSLTHHGSNTHTSGSQAASGRPGFRPQREDSLFRGMIWRRRKKAMDVPLVSHELETRKQEFIAFLYDELEKIVAFYKDKETQAADRLSILILQLHALRDHRANEVAERREEAAARRRDRLHHGDEGQKGITDAGRHLTTKFRDSAVLHPLKTVKQVQFRGTPKIIGSATPPSHPIEANSDFTRRPSHADTSYTAAKRQLKRAIQEYYRGLELLKSYALINRTAFRKINKKFDKALNDKDRTGKKDRSLKFYHENVEKAHFVESGVVDELMSRIEDLYARYFYNANRKVAASKLKAKNHVSEEYSSSVFRNGLTLGLGAILAIEALIKASRYYYDNQFSDPTFAVTTSYLMQLYAGYFLLLLLMLLFCLDCRLFHLAKVNYVFIFEFDTRNNLDWRQLSEIPCAFFLLMSLCMYLNFSYVGGEKMYLYWPVVLTGLTVGVVFLPAKILYHESRKWFINSLSRLITPIFHTVEFRDFFLGDMMCSETYSLGGIELFFCLYANDWINPGQCNSSKSYLMGFLATLPGILRMLQCFKRYYDSGSSFPHLANAGKYGCTILQYMTLSLFRMDRNLTRRAIFITFATINSIYTSIWDVCIDWSLILEGTKPKHPFLRERLAYKQYWWYYLAIVIDPIIRFNWIFYALPIFTDDIQHSAVLGFIVSLTEVFRRGIWTIFRVENEHCTNVGRFRASRDFDLPYDPSQFEGASTTPKSPSVRRLPRPNNDGAIVSPFASPADAQVAVDVKGAGADIEAARAQATKFPKSPGLNSLRRFQSQQGITPSLPSPGQTMAARVGTIIRGAHAQDFERKRRPPGQSYGGGGSSSVHGGQDEEDDEDSDVPLTDEEDEGEGEGAEAGDHGP